MIAETLRIFDELVNGSAAEPSGVLNPGDPGLLNSLDKLSAEEASATAAGGASVAAHADHLRYGLELLNRWSQGEEPFADADYRGSWRRTKVSEAEWVSRRDDLRREARRWREAVARWREPGSAQLNAVVSSVAHLAYHLGAIRQIGRSARGPSADD
jgi:hypothetical protein